MKKVLIGLLLIVLVYSGLLIFITGIYQKNTHQEVYNSEYYKGFDDYRKQVISLAILAPSSHNMQPWRIVLDENDSSKMDVYIEESRTLSVVDEQYNQMVISCGTFIAYLVEAGNELGYDVTYQIFPLGELSMNPTIDEIVSTPIATITIVENQLNNQVNVDAFTSATTKGVFSSDELDETTLNQILSQQSSNISIALIQDDADLKDLLIQGVQIESEHEEAMKETSSIFRYTTREKNEFSYGLSMNSGFSSKFILANVEFLNALFPMSWEKEGEFWLNNEIENINSCSTFGIISGDNTRTSQLEAGIALGHIYYQMKNENISVQPIVQVTELYNEMSELRTEFNDAYAGGNTVHVVFRIGYVEGKSLPSLRLTPDDIIE